MSTYTMSRSTHVSTDPARLHDLIDDFHAWPAWSPWEGLDPDLERSYSGAPSGVGAHYAWSGNRKAGEGSMEITSSSPERIEITLEFLKPWKAVSETTFELTPRDGGTDVTWRMTGEQRGLSALVGKVMPMDKLVGKDFERGLAQLKSAAEARERT